MYDLSEDAKRNVSLQKHISEVSLFRLTWFLFSDSNLLPLSQAFESYGEEDESKRKSLL